jgi:NTP pyrophosphatase (non-canonical NTP hydrolase)
MDTKEEFTSFIKAFNKIAELANTTAVTKGFWDDRINLVQNAPECLRGFAEKTVEGAALALIHSEISEALEASRHGNPPDDKIKDFSGVEAELADAIIRIMDLCHYRGWRVAEALVEKMNFNSTRPYKHGKQF